MSAPAGAEQRYDPVKEFLRSAIEARIDLRRHKKRVAELDAQCKRLAANLNGMPGGGGDKHGHENVWNLLADAREQEMLAMRRAEEQKRTVECFINCLPIALHRSILKLKYIDDLTWVRVQFALYEEGVYYDERHIRRIHYAALQAAHDLWRRGGPWEQELTEEGAKG